MGIRERLMIYSRFSSLPVSLRLCGGFLLTRVSPSVSSDHPGSDSSLDNVFTRVYEFTIMKAFHEDTVRFFNPPSAQDVAELCPSFSAPTSFLYWWWRYETRSAVGGIV